MKDFMQAVAALFIVIILTVLVLQWIVPFPDACMSGPAAVDRYKPVYKRPEGCFTIPNTPATHCPELEAALDRFVDHNPVDDS